MKNLCSRCNKYQRLVLFKENFLCVDCLSELLNEVAKDPIVDFKIKNALAVYFEKKKVISEFV